MVSLEPVEPPALDEPVPAEDPEAEEATPEAPPPTPEEPPSEPTPEAPAPAPAPKRRGRPKKDPSKPQQAVRIKKPPPVSSSSEEDPLSQNDMETMLIDYLYKRKMAQQNARRARWSQLAGLV